MAKMTVDEMIWKFNCQLAEKDGKKGILISGKPGKNQMEQLRAAKDEIIAELEKREVEEKARKAEEKAKMDAELEGLKNGSIPIKASYHDGEYLMGYQIFGQAAKLLEEIGVAKYISGWGYHVEDKAIGALGKEFTYAAAVEYMRPAKEAAEAKKAKAEAERQAKFDEAKAAGKKVLLEQWSEDCCDRHEECNLDIHSEWAMPDGTTTHAWTHTW